MKNFEAEREDQERQDYDDGLREEQDREERELFRQIQEDERDDWTRKREPLDTQIQDMKDDIECQKDNEPQDPDK